jgi:hypothetical protein
MADFPPHIIKSIEEYAEERNPYESIPEHIYESLVAYARERRPTGHFLEAVLSNDLYEAVNRADHNCMRELRLIVICVTNSLPKDSYGSEEKYEAWING